MNSPAALSTFRLSWREKRLLAATYALLWQAKAALALKGFGDPRVNCRPICMGPEAPAALVRRVAWSVERTARFAPGATCLVKAIAGRKLLALKGYASSIRVGVRDADAGGFQAHAWLVSGDLVVLGGSTQDLRGYAPMVGTS